MEIDYAHIEQRILAHLNDAGMLSITGEITCDFVNPRIYAAFMEGKEAIVDLVEDMLQEIIDEEGCGAAFCAMTVWEDD